ncbi:MAG: M1 family peptidase [Calditrichaeota bacterium]|nr:MAG: M1 family peptidase [Calditrichota bacterium]
MLIMSLLFIGTACQQEEQTAKERRDVHSFANTDEVVVTHMHLDLKVDFPTKTIVGVARLQLNNKTATDRLVLDTRDLTIEKVTLGEDEQPAQFELGEVVEEQPYLGRPLIISITPETKVVTVHYRTSPTAAALQWLEPAQTAGKKHPFLFTQSQAILARTWVPCQDSPGVRFTYTARVTTDPALLAVMSARNPTEKNGTGVYEFEMEQPIPSYLLALAVGDIEFRPLGPRSGVYAEPPVIAAAAYEFADTEKMMDAAERLYGPYRWERYDIIVLPPSFPFGGMENPRLTFATPTVLAGDRSLVALVAHELAHSWSGNLVTNATWNDFWLNEGFTTYIENRIMEELYGREYALMLAQLGYQDVVEEMKRLKPEDTHLHLNLAGRDPDEGMTNVAYEKGRLFLRMLEETFGREKWDAFLRRYFDEHAFQTMTSSEFLAYLREHLIQGDEELEKKLQLEAWVYGPGLPDNCPVPQSGEFARVEAQIEAWKQGTPARQLDTSNWTTHHWLHFLRHLPEPLTPEQMADLDNAFGFTVSRNSEIQCAWFLLAIRNHYQAAYPALEDFLIRVGRRKFLKPLYEELAKTPEGLAWARKVYQKARPGYHSVSYLTIDQILKVGTES